MTMGSLTMFTMSSTKTLYNIVFDMHFQQLPSTGDLSTIEKPEKFRQNTSRTVKAKIK